MKLYDILGEKAGKFSDLEITGITDNSGQVMSGYAFLCVQGTHVDRHDYAAEALKRGASVIICERDLGLENQLIVDNARLTFAEMSAKWFGNPQKSLKIIGVTGTNGKTSVSYMIKGLLESAGHKVGLIGTIQNIIGDDVLPAKNTTPSCYELHSMFSLMNVAGCDYCVMEVSSHALHQGRVHGVEFYIGIFTNLTQDHLDYHGTMENYLNAKKKLFKACKTAVLNMDDSYFEKLSSGLDCKVLTYSSKNRTATYYLDKLDLRPDGSAFEVKTEETVLPISTKIGGRFTPYNAVCAVACALEAGLTPLQVSKGFSALGGIKGRAEAVPTDKDFSVIIDYAHTPDGLENILKTFSECEKNRLIVLFGCGGDRDRTKRPKMGKIAVEQADYVIVTSDNPRTENPENIIKDILAGTAESKVPVEVIEDRTEAIKKAVQIAQKGDIIVLAGKGHETYQILAEGTVHFDEREIVLEALRKK